ncbi:MAG: hypothetical protein LBN99_07810 [Oscillospiraceae bacterium]|nr:hypothetical protein [Oscillospiraceae bacterium]
MIRRVRELLKENRHVYWTLAVLASIAAFFIFERLVVRDTYYVAHVAIDDKIPFIPAFVVPYCMWYPALLCIGLHHMIREPEAFRRYAWALSLSILLPLAFCAVFPNGQDMRPALEHPDTLFTKVIAGLYAADTNTNVLPSMHVTGLAAIIFAVFDSKYTRKARYIVPSLIVCALIAVSTVFIKQHSMLDIYWGLVTSAVIYVIVYVVIKRFQNASKHN